MEKEVKTGSKKGLNTTWKEKKNTETKQQEYIREESM